MGRKRTLPTPEPPSVGHQKLLALGLSDVELGCAVHMARQVAHEWRMGRKPSMPARDRLRGRFGISLKDWDMKPTPPEPGSEPSPVLPPAAEVATRKPPETDQGDELEQLEGLLTKTRAAQGEASGNALSTLLTNERATLSKIADLREQRSSDHERILASPLLQSYYRIAVEILRPALGGDWPLVVGRIRRAWHAADDQGQLPEGYEL